MPIYRSRENALRNALRAFVASVLTGFLLVLTGWSMAAFAWAMTGVIICLSANAPDPAAMTKGALIGLPTAIVLGGITQFLILGGVDAFPLFMIGTAPALFAALLVASSPKPALAGGGLVTTVYTIVVMQPSNPQGYDPQSYVLLSTLLVLVALLAYVLVRVLLPTTPADRRRWVLASARRDMRTALRGERSAWTEDENRLLDASRIGTLASLPAASRAEREADLEAALRMADLARAARRVRRGLDRLADRNAGADRRMRDLVPSARTALAEADALGLRRTASALVECDDASGDEASLALAADMAWAADLIDAPADPAMAETAR